MSILCPQHKIELEVENRTLSVLGKRHSVAVGKCPRCRIQYINRNLFPTCATFEIAHQTYQFLEGVKAVPEKVQPMSRTTDVVQESNHAVEQMIKPALTAEPAKRITHAEKMEPIHAKSVWYELCIPDVCPNDMFPLSHIKDVMYTVNGNPYRASGAYCRHCQTLFQTPTSISHRVQNSKDNGSTGQGVIPEPQRHPEIPSKSSFLPNHSTDDKKDTAPSVKSNAQSHPNDSQVITDKQNKEKKKHKNRISDTTSNHTLLSITNATKKPKEVLQRVAESARQGNELRNASSAHKNDRSSGLSEVISQTSMMQFIKKEAGKVQTKLTAIWLEAENGETYIITLVVNPQYKNISKGIFSVECDVGKDILNHINANQSDIILLSKPYRITKYAKSKALDIYMKDVFRPSNKKETTKPIKADIIKSPNTIQVMPKDTPEVPSEITTISLRSQSWKQYTITIVEDVSYQNTKKGIYWRNRSLCRKLLEHLKSNKPEIICFDESCVIEGFTKTTALEAYLNDTLPPVDRDLFVTIWMYKGKIPCPQHPDEVEAVTAYVPSSRDFSEHPLNINYCRRCRKYYINSVQFNLYAQTHGMPLVNLRSVATSGAYADYSTWQEESILHFLGYNVNANDNIPEYARHQLLAQAMDAGIVSKPNVSSFLEGLIRRSEGRVNFQAAIGKWKRDLQFVANYKIHDQRKVFGRLKIHR